MTKLPSLWFALWILFLPFSVSAQVVISEFMASNSVTLADTDGEFPDWIEIVNTGFSAVDLEGWYLTDDENFDVLDPESVWIFPQRVLAAGDRLVVFASGKNRSPAAPGELHANFQLAAEGEYLALIGPDGATIASEFGPGYPDQEADISYGTGEVSHGTIDFIEEGADVKVLVPANGSLGSTWTGGAEPFNDAAWIAARTGVGFETGSGPSGFALIDNFDSLNAGALSGQGGWSASSDSVSVGYDPANVENQVMAQNGDNVRAWKAMDIPNGATATLFYRMRRDGVVNINIGASDIASPGTDFSDFEAQLNNQNDAILNVRDIGDFDPVGDLADNTWYEIWMVIDTATDTYKVYMRGGALEDQTLLDSGAQTSFGFRNGAAANSMASFLARTGNNSSGTWSIDDIYLADGENLGSPAGGLSLGSFIDPAGDVEAEMAGESSSAYLRIPFDVGDLEGLASLTLRMRYDDGFVAYLNGTQIASRNAPVSPAWNATATAEHAAQDVVDFEAIDVTVSAALLVPNAVNVLAVHGLNLNPADGDFLITPELIGVESGEAPENVFFTTPTPGEANGGGVLGFVGDTQFSNNRGFYEAPFNVMISSTTPGATIIYTTDGSTPTLNHGTAVPAPAVVSISTTTPLRAAAFKDGYLSTNVDTQTYIFVSDVVNQGNTHSGYPSTWKGNNGEGTVPADYGMDPEITGSAAYSGIVDDALLAVPTISLVTDKEHFFDVGTGIYQNPQQHGSAWERPVSIEIIHPDGTTEGIQVDAGIRIQGGHTRAPRNNPKHSFRVSFKSKFGPTKLRYDLFKDDPDATKEFDELVLRGAGNQSWLHHNTFKGENRERAQYIRDQWAKDTQLEMGHPAIRSIYAHLYINGIYWGLYNPTERASGGFGESYLGGTKEDYNALNSGEGVDGDSAESDYAALIALANGGLTDPAAYAQMAATLDLEAFTDYMLIHQYGGNLDWDHHNWYALRNKNGGKWYFISWDSEFVFIDLNDNVLSLDNSEDPSRIWLRLMQNEEYRLLFADRVQKHFYNGGLLTPDTVIEMWDTRKDQMFDAIVGESARWGDYRRDVDPRGDPTPRPLYDRDEEWMAERTRLFTSYFPGRTDTVIAQYRAEGYLPNLEAPVFEVHGGHVANGYPLGIMNPGSGDIYYTTDGSDPRLATSANQLALLPVGAAMRVFVPSSDALGTTWHGGDEPFDDSAWLTGAAAGYEETPDDYAGLFDIDLKSLMLDQRSSCYVRMEFTIPDQVTLESILNLSMGVRYDDGFAAFLNGESITSANAPAELSWDETGASHPDSQAVVYQPFNIGAAGISALKVGVNVLAFHAFNVGTGSSDFLIDATLTATISAGPPISAGAELYTGPVPINGSISVRARVLDGTQWSPLTDAAFFTGTPASDANLVISEIMYNPDGPDDSEFIEFQNIGAGEVDLSGLRFSEGIEFEFPLGATLAAGGRVLLVRDEAAFTEIYGAGLPIAGVFANDTVLDNGGENLTLFAEDGSTIRTLRYNDKSPWPVAADGDGFSLVLIRPEENPDHALPENWRVSATTGGNPNSGDSIEFTGVATADDDGDGVSALLEYALGTSDTQSGDAAGALTVVGGPGGLTLTVQKAVAADDVIVTLQQSLNLIDWQPADGLLMLEREVFTNTGIVIQSYGINTVGSENMFLRIRATER